MDLVFFFIFQTQFFSKLIFFLLNWLVVFYFSFTIIFNIETEFSCSVYFLFIQNKKIIKGRGHVRDTNNIIYIYIGCCLKLYHEYLGFLFKGGSVYSRVLVYFGK